jgi:hypothetical protein
MHPLDELCRRLSGRKSRDAFVQKPAISQKFDISKDLLLARFGSGLAVRQEFGRGDLGGHGWECRQHAAKTDTPAGNLASDHQGLGAHLTAGILRAAALFALLPFLIAGTPVVSQQAICDAVQSYVNMLVDYTRTACVPTDTSSDTFTFLVRSSKPIFSVKDKKKAWLIAVVLSLGNAMNSQPDAKAGDLYVADADMEINVAYVLPIDLAKSLQKEVSAGQPKLGAMYEKIEKSLVRKELPKP